MDTPPSSNTRLIWVVLFLVALLIIATVAIPVWLIQPFRPQTERSVALSYALRKWAPLVTVIGLAAALGLVVWIWQRTDRWWRKALLAIVILPLIPATWFARQNHFEWMFNPLPNPAYAKAADAAFLSDADVLISININGDAVGYPIRFMAYHHLVGDVAGGTPIVATY